MSNETKADTHDRGSLPTVLVLVAGEKRDLNIDYPNFEIRYQSDLGDYKNNSDFFNDFLKQAEAYDICAFMNEYSFFTYKDSLTRIAETLWSHNIFGGIYTDVQMVDDNKNITHYQMYPSYDPRLMFNKFIVNGPLFIKTSILLQFDTQFSVLTMWDAYINYCKNTMMYHIPEPIISIQHNDTSNQNITAEFKAINDKT